MRHARYWQIEKSGQQFVVFRADNENPVYQNLRVNLYCYDNYYLVSEGNMYKRYQWRGKKKMAFFAFEMLVVQLLFIYTF